MVKIDLHMHGPIGYHPYWLRSQGYKGKNLLQLHTDICLERRIDLCAITSEDFHIPKLIPSCPADRFGCLASYAESLPEDYEPEVGENIISVKKGQRKVKFLNAQAVIVKENGKRFTHVVIGSNQVPNGEDFEHTIDYASRRGLIQLLGNVGLESHFGVGLKRAQELLKEFGDQIHAIEGYDAQMILPRRLSRLPKIGQYSMEANDLAQKFAEDNDMCWIAISNAHWIESAGMSNIISNERLDESSERALFTDIGKVLKLGKFENETKPESYRALLSWLLRFQWGIRGKKYKRE
ncbi:MAG: hypothetical protein IIA87_01545 [Nanoarchaeota archaeon]|nr:hypothetical protein [Nanoarchaeota archaeon]